MVGEVVVEESAPIGAKIVESPVRTAIPESNPIGDPRIAFSDWSKVDLRVGLIENVESVVGKDKLYKLTVDFSTEKRTILAGLKQYYSVEELKGKKTVFVFNLAPRMLAGIESNGMILAAKTAEGKYKITLIDESVPQGTRLE